MDHSVETFDINEKGVIAYTTLSTTEPIELWVTKKDKPQQLTELNKSYKKKTQIMPHERFAFKSKNTLALNSNRLSRAINLNTISIRIILNNPCR